MNIFPNISKNEYLLKTRNDTKLSGSRIPFSTNENQISNFQGNSILLSRRFTNLQSKKREKVNELIKYANEKFARNLISKSIYSEDHIFRVSALRKNIINI